jgi:hypothetical protein
MGTGRPGLGKPARRGPSPVLGARRLGATTPPQLAWPRGGWWRLRMQARELGAANAGSHIATGSGLHGPGRKPPFWASASLRLGHAHDPNRVRAGCTTDSLRREMGSPLPFVQPERDRHGWPWVGEHQSQLRPRPTRRRSAQQGRARHREVAAARRKPTARELSNRAWSLIVCNLPPEVR